MAEDGYSLDDKEARGKLLCAGRFQWAGIGFERERAGYRAGEMDKENMFVSSGMFRLGKTRGREDRKRYIKSSILSFTSRGGQCLFESAKGQPIGELSIQDVGKN